MIPHVVLCLAYQRERMAYQNSSSNSYIVVHWCSDTICEMTTLVIHSLHSGVAISFVKLQCGHFTNGIATPLHDNIGV